jgi:hypothetical protein
LRQKTAVAESPATSAGRLIAVLSAGFICGHAQVDPDLWGHVRFGLDMLASHRLAATDPYSFTQDVSWINHEWLSEISQAAAYRSGGVFGLILLKTAVLVGAFLLFARVTRVVAEPRRWWMLAAGIIAVAPAAYTIRPQLWTVLAIPLLWYALNHRWALPAMPLLFAVWANLHGGWIVGAGVGALWIVGRTFDRRPPRLPIVETAALAAGIAATLFNPYRWQLWSFLLTTVRVSRNISEWRPLWQQEDVSSAVVWIAIACVIVVPTLVRRRAQVTWAAALPMAWLAISSVFVARLVPFFGEAALLGLSDAWRSPTIVRRPSKDEPATSGPPTGSRGAGRRVIDAVALAAIWLFNVIPASRCLPIAGDWTPDLTAASAFDAPAAQGRLVLPFNWGEYAIWHWAPRLRVSMDGRRETIYSEATIDLQTAVSHGMPEGLDYLARVRPEYVWLPATTGATVREWAATHGYRIDVSAARSFVATRTDLPPLQAGTAQSRCFP